MDLRKRTLLKKPQELMKLRAQTSVRSATRLVLTAFSMFAGTCACATR